MSNLFWWMKNDTSIIKAYWFYMPRLNVLFNVLNAGALKTNMKTHKKVEPKSGSMMKKILNMKKFGSQRRRM